MTQLIFLGEELDPTKEHELLIDPNDHPFGVNAILQLKEPLFPTSVPKGGEEDIMNINNLTEVHSLYHPTHCGKAPCRIAFESDIHGTGFTYDMNDIKVVHIVHASFKAEKI